MKCDISSCPHWDSQARECPLGEPGVVPQYKPHHNRHPPESLILTSLELGKILADRKATTFRAQGYCMYPLIRPGNILHIVSKTVKEVKVGDIAVCRREGFLFGHRTIEKRTHSGKPCIITRTDNSKQGNDGPTFEKDLLGIVSSIDRQGRRIATARKHYSQLAKCIISAHLKLISYGFTLKQRTISTLSRLQQNPWYRRTVRPFVTATASRRSFTVELPFAGKWKTGLFHPIPAGKFDIASTTWQGHSVDKWRLTLSFNGKSHPAAQASFVLRPPECPFSGWWLEDLQVRVRYQGADFEKELISMAEEILACGGEKLYV